MKHFLAFILICIIFLTGCNDKHHKTTIKFMSWGSKSEVKILRQLITEFEKQNPDIKIEFLHTPQNYFQKLHLLVASRLTPDVVFVNNIYGPLYAENNVFMDLKPKINPDNFHEKALQAFNYKDTLYAIPRDVSNLVIYYNKDIFDKHNVPYPTENWTLEEFLQICKKITTKDNWAISFREEPLFWLPYIWSNHEVIDSIQFYADLRHKHHAAPTKSQAASATMAQLFMRGRLAMHLSGRWFMPIYKREVKFNWGITMFPAGKAGSVVGCDSSGWAISSGTKHPDESWRFVEFISSKQSIEKFTQSGLITPARVDVDDPEEIFTEVIKYSKPTPIEPDHQRFVDELDNTLEPVWSGRVTAREAIDETILKRLENML